MTPDRLSSDSNRGAEDEYAARTPGDLPKVTTQILPYHLSQEKSQSKRRRSRKSRNGIEASQKSKSKLSFLPNIEYELAQVSFKPTRRLDSEESQLYKTHNGEIDLSTSGNLSSCNKCGYDIKHEMSYHGVKN